MVFKKNSNDKIMKLLATKGVVKWLSGEYNDGYKSILTVQYANGHIVTKKFRRIMDGKGCICDVCNREKHSIGNKGKVRTEEHKKKYRESKLGDKNPAKGLKWNQSEEAKRKMALSKLGNKNPSWKDDLTPEEREANRNRIESSEHRRWSFRIKKRDNFECQICFYNKKLESHHIEAYVEVPEKRFLLRNGICLCRQCHREFHSTFGNKNINRQQLNQFKKGKQLSLLLILSCFLK